MKKIIATVGPSLLHNVPLTKVHNERNIYRINGASILDEVEYILIDRGDLSTEVGLSKIPYYQNYLVNKAVFAGKKVFLATQFLKSMEKNPIATFPEVIDLYNILKSGIYGIQMSEETAVGKYPQNCLDTIVNLMEEIHNESLNT